MFPVRILYVNSSAETILKFPTASEAKDFLNRISDELEDESRYFNMVDVYGDVVSVIRLSQIASITLQALNSPKE